MTDGCLDFVGVLLAKPRGSTIRMLDLYSGVPPRTPTYREIEVKLPVSDVPNLLRVLRKLGARTGHRVLERNVLFDTPQSDLRRQGRLLRVRIESPAANMAFPGGENRVVLTSKAPAPDGPARKGSHYKEKLERERSVTNPREFQAALQSLGFVPGFRYEKYRTTFRYLALHLSLDETPVGIFIELEGSPRAIDSVARSLGYSPRDYVKSTYWDLYSADCRRRGVRASDMLLQT